MPDEKKLMKYGLLVAAAIIVIRIILEQAGAPLMANNVFGVAWLYFILPVLFALAITARGCTRPYTTLLKDVVLFAVYTRIMVAITYVLAYYLKWSAPRFSERQGGTVGESITPLLGLLVIPVRNAIIWVLMAAVLGMIIGSITVVLRGKRPQGRIDPA